MVEGDIIVSEQKEYKTDCEISYSADEFHILLEMVSQQKGDIWILGDFNYQKLHWDEVNVHCIRPGCSLTKLYEVSSKP